MEFKGQLSLTDIYNMTHKEIGYLRKHRRMILANMSDAEKLNQAFGG